MTNGRDEGLIPVRGGERLATSVAISFFILSRLYCSALMKISTYLSTILTLHTEQIICITDKH